MIEKIAAPMNVNPRLIQYTLGLCGSPPKAGTSNASVAPSDAICASDKSTKITPRSTTCRPRYAWMPAMIRLAAIAGSRNCRIVQSIIRLLSRELLQRARQQVDVVVKQLDVIAGGLFAAD